MSAPDLLNSGAFLFVIGGVLYTQYRLTRLETQMEMLIKLLHDRKEK